MSYNDNIKLGNNKKTGRQVKVMYSFNELSESQKLTTEEKKTAKQILGLLNGQNQVAAKQMLDFCSYVIECNSNVAVVFEEERAEA